MLGRMSCNFVFLSLALFKYKVSSYAVAEPFSYIWYCNSGVQTNVAG